MTAFNYDNIKYSSGEIYKEINANIEWITWREYITLQWWSLFNRKKLYRYTKKLKDGMHAKYAFRFAKHK